MRSSFLLISFLSVAAPATPSPACVVVAPALAAEPAAWVLLAAAVLLLGAGRLAAS